MSDFSIQFDGLSNGFFIEAPGRFEGRLRFSIPEFHGKVGENPFSIKQALALSNSAGGGPAPGIHPGCRPPQLGISFDGVIEAKDSVAVDFSARVVNIKSDPIDTGHHTFLLDTTEAPEFVDPDTERTMMYTETGWESLAHLSNEPGLAVDRRHRPFNIGAAYNKTTIMWRMLGRVSTKSDLILGLGISKGYTFASDHELYPGTMIGGSRWGTLQPERPMECYGKIYLLPGSLNDMRDHYNKDFK